MDDEEDDIRLSVVDVYDIAADIGKEFEKIIDRYGADVLTSLMPRVITALEQLERVAHKQESSGAVIEELRSTISVLETQKIGQAEHRQRYARDLEDIERDMREEKQELSAKVSQLLDENRKLSTSLARSTDNTPSLTDEENSLEPESPSMVVARLQDALEEHRIELHQQQQRVQSRGLENEQLTGQVERVTQSNKDLRRRHKQTSQQIRQLVEERAELHVTLQEQQRSLDQLTQRLGLAAKENYDLATAQIDQTTTATETPDKLVYNRDDPNRPRFTLTELKDILYQRNELKARLSDLEDELTLYRPPKKRDAKDAHSKGEQDGGGMQQHRKSHIICPPDEANGPPLLNLDLLSLEENLLPPVPLDKQLQDAATSPLSIPSSLDEPAVQGPMPYEPDDAPWKRSRHGRESGIRKFFARMKKLSDVMIGGSEEVVLGTPTTTTSTTPSSLLYHQHHKYYHHHHSTPNTALSTPNASLLPTPPHSTSHSSPSSLRSLPTKLSHQTDGNVPQENRYSSTSTYYFSPKSTIQTSNDKSLFNKMRNSGLQTSSNQQLRGATASNSFSFEKFRNHFGLNSSNNSSSNSQNTRKEDTTLLNLDSVSLRQLTSAEGGSSENVVGNQHVKEIQQTIVSGERPKVSASVLSVNDDQSSINVKLPSANLDLSSVNVYLSSVKVDNVSSTSQNSLIEGDPPDAFQVVKRPV